MGLIGRIIEILSNTDDGEDMPDIKMDIGGDEVLEVPLFNPPGVCAKPFPEDYAAAVSHEGGVEAVVVGTQAPGVETFAENGEIVLYSRSDSETVVTHAYFKSDGTIKLDNDSGSTELTPGGDITASNGAASISATSSGEIDFSNSAGNITLSAAGIADINGNLTVLP